MSSTSKYCTQCGSPLAPDARFCGQCGQVVRATPVATPVVAPAAPQPVPSVAEPTVGIIPNLQRRKGFLGMSAETFYLVVTPGRLVFASVTSKMMQEAIAAARQEAKDQGKGFLGRFAAQMAWSDVICRQYQAMPVDAILAQYPGSFFIPNNQIKKVRLEEGSADEDGTTNAQVTFDTMSGKHKFDFSGTGTGNARQVLQQVLGSVVK